MRIMLIKTRFLALAILAICLVSGPNAYAGELDRIVVAEGMAPANQAGNDISLVRDIAILRAKQAAIEKLGVGLTSDTIVDMGLLLDEVVKVQTFALVKAYEIISEGEEAGQYRVKIKAWIVPEDREKPVMENLFAHRSIVVQAKGEGSRTIEKELLSQLIGKGYLVLDQGFAKWDPDYKIMCSSKIEFSEENLGIRSYHADCEIRLIKRSNARLLILERDPKDNRIFGTNRRQALHSRGPNAFPVKIARPMVKGFIKRLDTIAHIKEHDVDIIVKDVPDNRFFRDSFVGMIKAFRLGIKDVFNERYDNGTGKVTVRYAEKTEYLAAMIGFRSQYKVKKVSWDQIDVLYQGN